MIGIIRSDGDKTRLPKRASVPPRNESVPIYKFKFNDRPPSLRNLNLQISLLIETIGSRERSPGIGNGS